MIDLSERGCYDLNQAIFIVNIAAIMTCIKLQQDPNIRDNLTSDDEATLAGHPGESGMDSAMWRYYFWVGIAADVVSHVRACASCAKVLIRPLHPRKAMQLFHATMTFQDVATDLFGPLDKTAAGNESIFVTTDRFVA